MNKGTNVCDMTEGDKEILNDTRVAVGKEKMVKVCWLQLICLDEM